MRLLLEKKPFYKFRHYIYLFFLLIVAFSLRFYGIFWGIPPYDANYFHPDEPKVIQGAFQFPGDILTREDLRYPTAFHYLIGLLTWPVRLVSQQTKMETFQSIYLVGRLLSVTMGTVTILLVYWLAKRRYNVPISLIAATSLAFMMFHVTNSSWATTDVATSFFLALFLLFLLILLEHQSIWLALATGVSLGLLVGTKYTGALVVIPFVVLILVYAFQEPVSNDSVSKRILTAFSNRYLWIISITALIVFLLSTPTILIRPFIFFSSIQFEQARMEQSRLAFYELKTWQNAFRTLTTAVGLPLAIIACLGLVLSLISRKTFDISMAILVIAFFVYFDNALLPRYLILVMPVLALFTARFLWSALSSKQSWLKVSGWIVIILVLAYSFLYSIQGVISRYPDSRTLAVAYIQQNIPAGSEIGIAYSSEEFGWQNHIWRYPKIDSKRYKVIDFLDKPEFVIISDYDSQPIKDTLLRNILEDDMTLPDAYSREWYGNSPPSPKIFTFFQELYSEDSSYELIKKFIPQRQYAPIEFPAPTLEIFRRKTDS